MARIVRVFRSASRRGFARAHVRFDAEDDLEQQAAALYAQLSAVARELDESATAHVAAVSRVDRERFIPSGWIPFWRGQNIELIRMVEDETVQALKELFLANPNGPTLAQIREVADVSERRAKFWARDQALKLNSQIVQERALSVGIQQYGWDARDDGKTRPMHRALHGQVFDLLGPGPITNPQGDHNHPGEDYECRCTMDLSRGIVL